MPLPPRLARRPLALALVLGALGAAGAAQDSEPPRGWAGPPGPARVGTLAGGARVVRLESAELERLGQVEGLFVFRVGAVHEPRGSEGLVALLAASLVEGGSVISTGPELAAWLTAHGASVEVRSGLESVELAFRTPLEHFDALLEQLTRLLVSPAYPEERLLAAKQELLRARDQRSADPHALADDLMLRMALEPGSLWSRIPTQASLESLQRVEVLGFHRAHLGQVVLTLGLAAGREPRDLARRAERALSRLGRGAAPPAPPRPRFVHADAMPVWLIDVPDVQQVEVRVATPAPVDEPSTRALDLWMRALNLRGSDDPALRSAQRRLTGLLFERVEVRRSLAPFGWSVAGRAPVDAAVDACEAASDALSGNPRRPVSDEPLARARADLVVVRTPREELAQVTRDVAAGLAPTARRDELEAMAGLSREEVARAVHTRLAQRPPVVVVVGPVSELYAPLGLLGPVAVHSALARPRGSPQALALRERLFEALGGEQRWAQLVGVEYEGEERVVGSEQPTAVRRTRDVVRRLVRIDRDESGVPGTVVATPTGGWHRTMRSTYDLAEERRARLAHRDARQLDQVLHDLVSDPALEVRLGFEGRLDVFAGEHQVCWIAVADSGLPSSLGFGDGGDDPGRLDFSDWREEAGYAWPSTVVDVMENTLYRWELFTPVGRLLPGPYARPVK